MTVEKIGIIKTGDFSSCNDVELMHTLKYTAILLSNPDLFIKRYYRSSEYKEELSKFSHKSYEKLVSKGFKEIIFEIGRRCCKNDEGENELSALSNEKLYKKLLRMMSKLWNQTKREIKRKAWETLFPVFYQGELRTLLDEVNLRFSGVDLGKRRDNILKIKNGFIAYKRLLAKLLGEELIQIYARIQDYDITPTEEEAEKLTGELIERLESVNKWYLSRDENLSYLCRSYGIIYWEKD